MKVVLLFRAAILNVVGQGEFVLELILEYKFNFSFSQVKKICMGFYLGEQLRTT